MASGGDTGANGSSLERQDSSDVYQSVGQNLGRDFMQHIGAREVASDEEDRDNDGEDDVWREVSAGVGDSADSGDGTRRWRGGEKLSTNKLGMMLNDMQVGGTLGLDI